MRDKVNKYLEHLDSIFKVEPKYFKHSKEDEFPPFHTFTYRDIPEKGMVTGFTSGISFVEQPIESNVRPELLICVDTQDDLWVLALADIGYQHRGEYHFQPGDTINFNVKISDESDMTSFFVWHQNLIHEDYETICLDDCHIKLLQLFPVHDDERLLIHKHGPEWLFELVEDPCDVRRTSVAHKFKM